MVFFLRTFIRSRCFFTNAGLLLITLSLLYSLGLGAKVFSFFQPISTRVWRFFSLINLLVFFYHFPQRFEVFLPKFRLHLQRLQLTTLIYMLSRPYIQKRSNCNNMITWSQLYWHSTKFYPSNSIKLWIQLIALILLKRLISTHFQRSYFGIHKNYHYPRLW